MTDCEPTVYGPCAPYATLADVVMCPLVGLDLEDDAELIERELFYASRIMFVATGGQYWGCCEATVRPPPRVCTDYLCDPLNPCICSACQVGGDRVASPFLPVRSIVEINIEGTILDPANYRLQNSAYIVRIDGETFPDCQAEADLGEPGTWGYTIMHGSDLPPEAVPLVATFGIERAKKCKGRECGLDPSVRVVERDDVSYGILDPATEVGDGYVGFGPIDEWLRLTRGGHVIEPPRIYMPGRSMRATILERTP